MIHTRKANVISYLIIVLLATIMPLTPLYTTLAEIQATPVVEPTLTPTVEPTETPELIGTPAATTNVASEISPMSVDDGSGALSGCKQMPPGQALYRGDTVRIECTYEFTFILSIGVVPSLELTSPNLPYGYTATMQMVGESFVGSSPLTTSGEQGQTLVWSLGGLGLRVLDTFAAKVLIDIDVSNDATYAANPSMRTFSICYRGLVLTCDVGGSVTLISQVVPLEIVPGSDFYFDCSPRELHITQLGQPAAANCDLIVESSLIKYDLRIDGIDASINGRSPELDGWSIELPVLPTPSPTANPEKPFEFQIRMTPTGCTAAEVAPSMVVQLTVTPVLDAESIGHTVTTNADEVVVSANFTPNIDQTALVIAKDEADPIGQVIVPYSFEESTASSEMVMRFELSPCTPWFGYVEMDEFSKVVDEGEEPFPVPIITVFTGTDTAQDPPNQTTISHNDRVAIGTSSTLVLNGTAPDGQVTVDHSINLEYTIPANTPVGEYTSTITVTVASDGP